MSLQACCVWLHDMRSPVGPFVLAMRSCPPLPSRVVVLTQETKPNDNYPPRQVYQPQSVQRMETSLLHEPPANKVRCSDTCQHVMTTPI